MTKPEKLEQVRGHCPNCGPQIYADIVAEDIESEDIDERAGIWTRMTSRILRCGGCKEVYFQQSRIFSEDWDYGDEVDAEGRPFPVYNDKTTYYPAPAKRKRPEWLLLDVDTTLGGLLRETYRALDVDARVLAATGARTVFDRAAELLKINPAITFKEKLDALHIAGHIGNAEREHLDVLTDAAGAAARRGWQPTVKQVDTIMNILETFIYRTFVIAGEVSKLKAQIPPKQERQK
jgi:hypothetical protein